MAEYILQHGCYSDTATVTVSRVSELESDITDISSTIVEVSSHIESVEKQQKQLKNKLHDETRKLRKKIAKEQEHREAELSTLKSMVVFKTDFTAAQTQQEDAYNKLHDNMIQQMNWRFWLSIACSLLIGLALGLVIQFT